MSDTYTSDFSLEVDPSGSSPSPTELDPFSFARDFQELDSPHVSTALRSQDKRLRTAIIRTSDRITFRRCRRMWNWTHSSRGNLQSNQAYAPFWMGSGLHFAFEDFHGYRRFDRPSHALRAYYEATKATGSDLPSDVEDLLFLGEGMLSYYESWLNTRDPLQTYVVNNVPQVEVNVHIEISKDDIARYIPAPFRNHILDRYDRVLYSLTLDRVIIDTLNRLWIVEYKSAKQYSWFHLDTDPQVTAYKWGAQYKYPHHEVAGAIYQQHKKQILQPPAFLTTSRRFSTSKQQKTSYALYHAALQNLYGRDQNKFPPENRAYLEYLLTKESENRDELIKRDYVERNTQQLHSEYDKICMEAAEMLNPDLPIYPNPNRDCSWQCSFSTACVAMDDGSDWLQLIQQNTMDRNSPQTYWRDHLIYPN